MVSGRRRTAGDTSINGMKCVICQRHAQADTTDEAATWHDKAVLTGFTCYVDRAFTVGLLTSRTWHSCAQPGSRSPAGSCLTPFVLPDNGRAWAPGRQPHAVLRRDHEASARMRSEPPGAGSLMVATSGHVQQLRPVPPPARPAEGRDASCTATSG